MNFLNLFYKDIKKQEKNQIGLLYCYFHKISLKRGGSYVDSPEWLVFLKKKSNDKSKHLKKTMAVFSML